MIRGLLLQVTEEEYIERGEAVAVDASEVTKSIVRFATYSTLTAEDVNVAAKKTCYVLTELSKGRLRHTLHENLYL